ncbi:hypothetical protein [Rhodococcus gannanensis]|uniref:Uncharacterized protein n=1 Tax=Rhodococcus gannanensis TaxID=1960308 RepID=A0ABW4P8E5_9NOCA
MTSSPGAVLAQPAWLAQRVADTARYWRLDDDRVAATLWWYSASSVVVTGIGDLLTTGTAPNTDLDEATVEIAPDGRLLDFRSAGRLRDVDDIADALRDTLAAIVDPLATLSGATPRALWAVASDSLANRCLNAGSAALASGLATRIGEPLPVPRFVDVGRDCTDADTSAPVPPGRRRVVRRSSCCLIYRSPVVAAPGDPDAAARAKCVSCPRQRPEVRAARLTAL